MKSEIPIMCPTYSTSLPKGALVGEPHAGFKVRVFHTVDLSRESFPAFFSKQQWAVTPELFLWAPWSKIPA